MSKKDLLLKESAVRRFMKLANIDGSLTDSYIEENVLEKN